MAVADRIIQHAHRLTAAERRVAEVMAEEPDAVAFGTVANVARKASTSGPTVVRFAVKLGYAGFVDMQSQVQMEMAELLGPARDRIRRPSPIDLLGRVAAVEEHNVRRTLGSIPPVQFAAVVEQLSDPARGVWVLAGDATAPVGTTLAVPLGQLRAGVTLAAGSGVAAARTLGGLQPGDVLVAVDIRRYERWLLELTRWAAEAGADLVAITDSPLSPLAALAADTLLMSAEGVGPFDSMTAGVALANALVVGVSARVRDTATSRLDAIEAAWRGTRSLVADPDGSVLPTPAPARRIAGGRPAAGSERKPANGHRGEGEGVDSTPLAGVAALDGVQALAELPQPVEP